MDDQEQKPEEPEEVKHAEIDLMQWALDEKLDFNQFSEAVFVMAITLGLQVQEAMAKNEKARKDLVPTFKFSHPDAGGMCELYIRRIPESAIIKPKEKKIILN